MTGEHWLAGFESFPQQHQRPMKTNAIHRAQAEMAEIGCAFHPPGPPLSAGMPVPSSGAFNSLSATCESPFAAGTFALLTD